MFVDFVLRLVGCERRQFTESQQRLLLHKVTRLHVGLAVERPVRLQRRQSETLRLENNLMKCSFKDVAVTFSEKITLASVFVFHFSEEQIDDPTQNRF